MSNLNDVDLYSSFCVECKSVLIKLWTADLSGHIVTTEVAIWCVSVSKVIRQQDCLANFKMACSQKGKSMLLLFIVGVYLWKTPVMQSCISVFSKVPLDDNFFFLSLPRMPFDPRHPQQWSENVHQQQPPGCPEKTEWHRAQGQTGRREHDSDVLQRTLQGRIQQERKVHLTFRFKLIHVRMPSV